MEKCNFRGKSISGGFGGFRAGMWFEAWRIGKTDVVVVLRTMFQRDMACRDGVIQVIFSRDPLVLGKSAGQSESTICKFWVGFWAPAAEIPKEIG